jgi:hypothetical protein
MNKSLVIQNDINQSRLQAHLDFIDSFVSWCKENNWRTIVYGGYGLDGYLQAITRNHGDIDLVMYGQSPRSVALGSIVNYLNKTLSDVEVKTSDEEFFIDIKIKSKNIQGNFYYVQTAENPFSNLNIVIKVDGSVVTNSPKDFPPPVPGKLGNREVEVQDQKAHLEDILRKRSTDESHARHDQDIENISKIAS